MIVLVLAQNFIYIPKGEIRKMMKNENEKFLKGFKHILNRNLSVVDEKNKTINLDRHSICIL